MSYYGDTTYGNAYGSYGGGSSYGNYEYTNGAGEALKPNETDISKNSTILSVPEGAVPEGESPYPEGEGAHPEGETAWPEGETLWPEGESIWPEGEGWPEGEPEGYAEPFIPMDADHDGRAAFASLAGMLAAGIIILNIIALIAVSRKPKQRKTLTYLIGLMSAFDLLGGLQFAWFSSLDVQLKLTRIDYWIMIMCGIWMISMTPQITGLLHFGLHWLTELEVGVGNAKVTSGRIAFIIVTAICLPFILLIPPLAGWHCVDCRGSMEFEMCAKKCSNAIFPFPRIYVLAMIVLLLAAMILVTGVYIAVGVKMRNKRIEQGYVDRKPGNTKLYSTVCLLLAIYIFFTLPVSIVLIIDYVVLNTEENRVIVGRIITAFQATMFISFISNFLNPIIYFTMMRGMREALLSSPKKEDRELNGTNGYSNKHAIETKEQEASKI